MTRLFDDRITAKNRLSQNKSANVANYKLYYCYLRRVLFFIKHYVGLISITIVIIVHTKS